MEGKRPQSVNGMNGEESFGSPWEMSLKKRILGGGGGVRGRGLGENQNKTILRKSERERPIFRRKKKAPERDVPLPQEKTLPPGDPKTQQKKCSTAGGGFFGRKVLLEWILPF